LAIDAILAGKYVIMCKSPNDIWYGIDEDDIVEDGSPTGIFVVNDSDEMKESIRKYNCYNNDSNTENRGKIITHFMKHKGTEVVERFWSEIARI